MYQHLLVNVLADVVVSHGGQGTIQTAIASGTPIVGFAMQPEQQINLDNVVMSGSGIRIPKHRWNANNIQAAIKNIVKEPSYKETATETIAYANFKNHYKLRKYK